MKFKSGEGGIWTLAPVSRPIPLAGAPLRPLEYFSIASAWRRFYYNTEDTDICQAFSQIYFSKFREYFWLIGKCLLWDKTHILLKENIRIATLHNNNMICYVNDFIEKTRNICYNTFYSNLEIQNSFTEALWLSKHNAAVWYWSQFFFSFICVRERWC